MMTDSERMTFLVTNFAGGNQAKFSQMAGIDKFFINRVISGKTKIRTKAAAIHRALPEINLEWLTSGIGESGFVSGQEYVDRIAEKDKIIENLLAEIETQRKVIDHLLGEK